MVGRDAMDGKENEKKSDARTLQKRAAATASNAAKRELVRLHTHRLSSLATLPATVETVELSSLTA